VEAPAVPAWVHAAACRGLERRKLPLPQADRQTRIRPCSRGLPRRTLEDPDHRNRRQERFAERVSFLEQMEPILAAVVKVGAFRAPAGGPGKGSHVMDIVFPSGRGEVTHLCDRALAEGAWSWHLLGRRSGSGKLGITKTREMSAWYDIDMPEHQDGDCRLPRFVVFKHLGGTFRVVKYFTSSKEARDYGRRISSLFDKVEYHTFSGSRGIWGVLVMPHDKYPENLPPA